MSVSLLCINCVQINRWIFRRHCQPCAPHIRRRIGQLLFSRHFARFTAACRYCCYTLFFLFRRVFCDRNAYIRYEYGICVGFSIKFANVSFSSSRAHSIRSTWPNIKCVYWMSALHSHYAVCMNGKSAFNIIKSTMYYAIGRVRRYISTIKHNKNGWSSDSLGCIGANSV